MYFRLLNTGMSHEVQGAVFRSSGRTVYLCVLSASKRIGELLFYTLCTFQTLRNCFSFGCYIFKPLIYFFSRDMCRVRFFAHGPSAMWIKDVQGQWSWTVARAPET